MLRRNLPALAATLCLPAVHARAQAAWPTRPVRIIVTFPPGGSSDFVARLLAEHLSQALGQRFLVDNRPGAGGTIAALAASREAPDGYNLLLSNSAPITLAPPLYPQAGYDPVRSFTHIVLAGAAPTAILVNNRFVPARDLPSLMAWMRAQSTPPDYGTSGTGSVGHILGEMFQRTTGIRLTHVPYRGSAALLPDLLNGQVPLAFETLPQYVEHFAAGRLTGIAVSSEQRNRMAPTLPTLVELGFPNLVVVNWTGLSGPARLPPAVVERLAAAALEGLRTEAMQTRLAEHAITPTPLGPAEFTGFVQRDVAEIGGMIRTLGITAG
jgi:tripartite-type tricarboxylate transporter receptor subunit TctC